MKSEILEDERTRGLKAEPLKSLDRREMVVLHQKVETLKFRHLNGDENGWGEIEKRINEAWGKLRG